MFSNALSENSGKCRVYIHSIANHPLFLHGVPLYQTRERGAIPNYYANMYVKCFVLLRRITLLYSNVWQSGTGRLGADVEGVYMFRRNRIEIFKLNYPVTRWISIWLLFDNVLLYFSSYVGGLTSVRNCQCRRILYCHLSMMMMVKMVMPRVRRELNTTIGWNTHRAFIDNHWN